MNKSRLRSPGPSLPEGEREVRARVAIMKGKNYAALGDEQCFCAPEERRRHPDSPL